MCGKWNSAEKKEWGEVGEEKKQWEGGKRIF